ncbi:glucan-binding repeat-containing protein [Oribacterium sp. KHPX15]|uniref:tetratricopeptide repeat protein n=1 Tax=Oribacterium sp. KHPX15 TaxID=1855342 RepID=UPI00089A4586|nr:tetratricopeptide repeat protein [Oribacterium sp. KHPX15]SDZ96441.1 glucan-binding repeat-containing protein [Oribacterium sp. KHPX15]
MEKKSSPIIIICVLTGLLLAALVGMLIFFNLPAQRIRRMLKTANKHLAEENYDEAILTLQKMLEIDPKNENLYIMLADTYEKNGDIEKEVEFLQEAVTLMPEKQKISEALLDVYPEVTLSKNSGTYTDPVTLSMSSSEGSEIFYKLSGSNNESKYSSPVSLDKNGEYTIEYYAVSKNGYEGDHKTATYVINLDESKYHFNEWVEEADGRHYYDENGLSVTGWFQLKGKWYLFDSNGVMLTGFREDKGNTYYLRSDGIMVTGWQDINGKRYYFDENGAMLTNQWIDDTYYVGADGAMLVDTVTPDGKKVGKDGRKIDEAWKKAYIDVINGKTTLSYSNENIYEFCRFSKDSACWNYAYINDDLIPELICTIDSSPFVIFSYVDDRLIDKLGEDASIKYTYKKNLIYIFEGEYYSSMSFMITPNGFEQIHYIGNAWINYSNGIPIEGYYDYHFDGKSVTEEEFNVLKFKYFNEADMIEPQGKYNSTEMIEIINNM